MKHGSLLVLFSFLYMNSFGQLTFEKTFTKISNEAGLSIIKTDDGGFLIGGKTNLSSYLIKTNNNGDTLWTRIFDAPYSRANSIKQTYDGGYIVCGSVYNGSKYFAELIKLNDFGDTLWTKAFGFASGFGNDEGFKVQQTIDSGFVIIGTTNNFGGNRGIYLVKTDKTGNLQWSNKFSSTAALFDGISVIQTNDGGYALLGTSYFISNSTNHTILIKTNSLGDTLWTKSIEGAGFDYPCELVQTYDKGFMLSGYSNSFNSGNWDNYLLKADSLGNEKWAKTYGETGIETCSSLRSDTGGNFLISGSTNSFSAGDDDAYLLYTDSSGTLLWSSAYGNSDDEACLDAVKTIDGGFIATGYKSNSVYLIKADSSGNSCSLSNVSSIESPVIFPINSLPIIVTNATSSTTNFNIPINSGAILNTICYNPALCSTYTVNASSGAISSCQSPIQLNAIASTVNSIYQWSPSVNLNNSSIANPLVNYSFNQNFIVRAFDTVTGCIASDTIIGISAMNNYTEVLSTCGPFTVDFFLPNGASSYLWTSYNDAANNSYLLNDINQFVLTINAPAVYYGTATFPGCIVNGTFVLTDTCSDNVWPGDCNNDLVVDNTDFLYLGLSWGETGAARTGANTNWTAQACGNWNTNFLSGVNIKHADSDGNGLVDASDSAAIYLNYSRTHLLRNASQNTSADFYLVCNSTTVAPGDTITCELHVASGSTPIDSLYGIKFNLSFDQTLVDTNQIWLNYDSSVLGIINTDLKSFEKDFFSIGSIDAAVTRINHTNANNVSGVIGILKIVTSSAISSLSSLVISPGNVQAVTWGETFSQFNALPVSVTIDPNLSGINTIEAGSFELYPNPVSNLFYIKSNGALILDIKIIDFTGKIVYEASPNSNSLVVSGSELSSGIYTIWISDRKSVIVKKIQVIK